MYNREQFSFYRTDKGVYFLMDSMTISMFRNLKYQALKGKYQEIHAHELAHKNTASSVKSHLITDVNPPETEQTQLTKRLNCYA